MSIPTRLELESEIYSIVKILGELQKKVELGQISFFTYHEMIREKIRDLLFIELLFKKKGMDIEKIIDEMSISEEFLNIIPQIKNYILFKDLEPKKNQDIKKKTQYITTIGEDYSFTESGMKDQKDPRGPLKYFNEYRQRNQRNHISSRPTNIKPGFQAQSVQNSAPSDSILLNNTLFNPMTLARISADITSDYITILDFFHMKLTDYSVLFQLGDSLRENLKEFPGMEELAIDVSLFLKDLKEKFKQEEIDYTDLYSRFEKFYLDFKKKIILQSYQK